MSTQICLLALNSAMNEVRSVYPSIRSIFMFRPDGQILACDRDTSKITLNNAIAAFEVLIKRSAAHGGVNSASFIGTSRRIVFNRLGSFYLAMVVSNEFDELVLKSISGMVIPTVMRVLDVVHPAFIAEQSGSPTSLDYALRSVEAVNTQSELSAEIVQAVEAVKTVVSYEKTSCPKTIDGIVLPQAPVVQFMVENVRGITRLLGSQDIVYLDSSVIATWQSLYQKLKIEMVVVEETKTGKKKFFNFKSLKDSKLEGKGVIQMSEKVQRSLGTQKGALVTVKPFINPLEVFDE